MRTLDSFVNDGSEHRRAHIYIYTIKEERDTVDREAVEKKEKKDNSKRHTPHTRT